VSATIDGNVFRRSYEIVDAERSDRQRGRGTAVRGGERRERRALEADLRVHAREVCPVSSGAQVPRGVRARRGLGDQQRDQREDRDRSLQPMEEAVPEHRVRC